MKFRYISLGFIVLVAVNTSFASTDWTPFLKGVLHNCVVPDLENIPAQYKASIMKNKNLRLGNAEAGGRDLILRNSKAFGVPITAIRSYSDGVSAQSFSITFKNDDFMKLRKNLIYAPPKNVRERIDTRSELSYVSYDGDDSEIASYEGIKFDEKRRKVECYFKGYD